MKEVRTFATERTNLSEYFDIPFEAPKVSDITP